MLIGGDQVKHGSDPVCVGNYPEQLHKVSVLGDILGKALTDPSTEVHPG